MKHIDEINFENKIVMVRCDYNCPLNGDNKIEDDYRIKCSLDTLNKIISYSPKKLILMTHLGRPKKIEKELSTRIFLNYLEKFLKKKFLFLDKGLNSSYEDILNDSYYLMENVRFHDYEINYVNQKINIIPDVYCNEAFSCSHRKHASIVGINSKEKCFGYSFLKEVDTLNSIINNNNLKITAIIGGSKIDDKIEMLKNLSKKVNYIYIAGNNINAYHEKKNFLDKISHNKSKILLMEDGFGNQDPSMEPIYIKSSINKDTKLKLFDIGPKSFNKLDECIDNSDIIFWNGTLGIVEHEFYKNGSEFLVKILNKFKGKVIIGGGDTACFVNKFKNNFYHILTGGGASIEYLGNGTLPGILHINC